MTTRFPTVLIVDDSAADRELVTRLLAANFRVVTAPDVPAGLEAYGRESPECVLLNLHATRERFDAAHTIEAKVRDSGAKGTITITSRIEGPYVLIAVADTGCGIPSTMRDRIYDSFFTTEEIGKGTGQGLAIAHRIVNEHHGGTIDCDSEVGRGTRFTIRLPIVGPGEQATETEPADCAWAAVAP